MESDRFPGKLKLVTRKEQFAGEINFCGRQPVALKAFMSLQATTLSGFGLLLGVSFDGGHRRLLQTVMLAMHGEKDTMFPKELDFKNFHGPHTVPLRSWPP